MALAIQSHHVEDFAPARFDISDPQSSDPQYKEHSREANAQIASLKRQLAKSQAYNQQLNHTLNVMPTGMVMLDGNGVVIEINDMAKQLLDEPILGQPWFDVIKRSFKPRADDGHEVSLKDGRRVKLDISAISGQAGQLIFITDLTETRLLQDKLSQLQRLSSLGRMVSTLAHQIRTPLSAAMLYGANMGDKNLDGSLRANFQQKLMSRLGDLEQQVNDMLLFAKSGKQQVVEPLSVNDVVNSSLKGIEALVKNENATVELSTCPHQCHVLGNQTALTGAIQNLVHNALQVVKQDAYIRVIAKCENDHAQIHVIDNGEGISKDLADKIFEPFYTSKVQGTGLGLAVVKQVANAHQGEVKLLSNSGEGAHFCIQLPLLDPASIANHSPIAGEN